MASQRSSYERQMDGRPLAAVFGGGGAIGLGIARAYARRGYRLALLDYDPQRLAAAAGQFSDSTGYACDITNEANLAAAVERLQADHGRLDDLVHAAGLTHVSPFAETDPAVIRRVMEVNFIGVANVTRLCLPDLRNTRGRIVVLSSVCGFAPLVGRTGYCASKYALHGLFEALRCEERRYGVSVTMVCPSFVDSDFAARGLAGDGAVLAHARTTTGEMLAPDALGEATVRAAIRRRKLLVASRQGKLAYWISRFAPGLYQQMMARRFQKILESKL